MTKICLRCGSKTSLEISEHGFNRWFCPKCNKQYTESEVKDSRGRKRKMVKKATKQELEAMINYCNDPLRDVITKTVEKTERVKIYDGRNEIYIDFVEDRDVKTASIHTDKDYEKFAFVGYKNKQSLGNAKRVLKLLNVAIQKIEEKL